MAADVRFVIGAEDRTKAAFARVEKHLKQLSTAAFGAAAAVAILGAKEAVQTADKLAKLSVKTGVAIETLSGYAYAAALGGSSTEAMGSGIVKLSKAMQDSLITSTSASAIAFRQMGVDVVDSTGKLRPADAVLEEISKKFGMMADGTQKTAIAANIFGKSGADLIPTLNTLNEKAREGAGIYSTEFAHGAEIFNDELVKMEFAFQRMIAGGEGGSRALEGLTQMLKWAEGVLITTAGGFEALGTNIGAFAASTAAVMRGEWSGAVEIMKARADDIDAIEKRVNAATEALHVASTIPAPEGMSQQEFSPIAVNDAIYAEDYNKYTALLSKKAEALLISQETEAEQVLIYNETKSLLLEESWLNEVITKEQYDAGKVVLEEQTQNKLTALARRGELNRSQFEKMSGKNRAKTIFGFLAEVSSAGATHNKEMFELNKAAGIANAIVSTYEGAAAALKIGPWGIPLAAVVVAAGMANINAISSSQFGGGATSAPSVSGGMSMPTHQAPNLSEVGGSQGSMQRDIVVIQGLDPDKIFSGQQVRDLMGRMYDTETTGVSFS